MRFHFTLASCFVFVSAALADHRRGHHRSRPLGRRDLATEFNPNWAGAVWEKDDGTFTSVTGTFKVPAVSGTSGSVATAWVGLDGHTCNGGLFQAGIDFYLGPSYGAWVEWVPDVQSTYYGDLPISAGDVIRVNITATSIMSGIATIENLTNGQQGTKEVTSTHALCGQNAEWIVEAYDSADWTLDPFANFGTVIFTDAMATGPGGTFTPNGAVLDDIKQNDTILTSVAVSGDDLVVTYVGP